ncbi:MAG: Crp/Fnr family transcriptional regulator [Methylophaga sp.]|nr:Crp/Fnr family transcriptional regulator [Methylophaga sp.]
MKESLPLYNTYRHRLSQSRLFRGLSLELLDDMLSHFRFESWNKGSQHDSKIALQRFYVILEGRMELMQVHPQTGKQITLLLLEEGDVYDILTLLDDQQHDIIPVALDDLKLLSAPIDEVREWIKQHPEFNKNYMPYLGRCIRRREALLTDLALYETQTRLARLILRYACLEDMPDELSGSSIDVGLLHDLSNEVLAEMIGSVRQVVNRHLQLMKKEGILHYENHHLIIDDLEKLRQYADDVTQQLEII